MTDDSTGPLFSVTNATPGATGTHCIQISSTSPAATSVKLYTAIGTVPVNDVSTYITIVLERGTGGTYGDCTNFTPAGAAVYNGTLAALTSTRTNYDNGLGPWALAGTTTTVTTSFRITWTLSASTPSSAQGGSTPPVTLTWEART
ncbi:hypothetical protein [Actinophytocola sp.]|uniref:hypothetical protein n=1 Tax=Actinophytocola sp. TaxID=1872138 RepID=UPI002ED57D4F